MIKSFFLTMICLFVVLLEGSITTLPLVLVFLLLYAVFSRNQAVFLYAFLSGIFLDVLQLRSLGTTELFFIFVLFLLFLYQRKFEIATLPFIIVSVFVTSAMYTLLFVHHEVLQQVVIITVATSIVFGLLNKIVPRASK